MSDSLAMFFKIMVMMAIALFEHNSSSGSLACCICLLVAVAVPLAVHMCSAKRLESRVDSAREGTRSLGRPRWAAAQRSCTPRRRLRRAAWVALAGTFFAVNRSGLAGVALRSIAGCNATHTTLRTDLFYTIYRSRCGPRRGRGGERVRQLAGGGRERRGERRRRQATVVGAGPLTPTPQRRCAGTPWPGAVPCAVFLERTTAPNHPTSRPITPPPAPRAPPGGARAVRLRRRHRRTR